MAHTKKSTFLIPLTAQTNNTFPVTIVDTPCSAENLVLTTWSSAGILSKLLHKLETIDRAQFSLSSEQQQDENNPYSVLELGAGTGLSGLAAAAVWRTRALLTDLPTIVPGIHANVLLNADMLRGRNAGAAAGTLDWKNPNVARVFLDNDDGSSSGQQEKEIKAAGQFPVVLAADTMYAEDHPVLLTQAILACLKRSREARAVVVYAMRVAYIEYMREFWELMEAGGLVSEVEGREEIDLREWDDEKLHEWSVWKWKDL